MSSIAFHFLSIISIKLFALTSINLLLWILLNFQSKDINNIPASHLGTDFEIRAKIGWIYEVGWGHIFRAIYSTFYMPNNIDKNTGKEIKFFGEIIKSF